MNIVVEVKGRREGIYLSPGRIARLEAIARKMGTRYGNGSRPGWRALVNAIAEGKLEVVLPEVPPDPRTGDSGEG